MIRLLALLVFAPLANAASIETEWCDNDRIVSAPLGECPGVNSNLVATPSDTSVMLTYDSTSAAGTSYVYVVAGLGAVPPGCAANTTIAERRLCAARVRDEYIVAGTGAEATASHEATSGSRGITVTGLAADTGYTAIVLDKDGPNLGGLHGEPAIVSFTTTSTPTGGGGGGSPETPPAVTDDAPEWYVGVGGSDLASGLSRANRLATLDAVLALIDTGDDVAIQPGSVFEDYQLIISTGGTSDNRAIWGTNYESGGVDYWWGEGPNAEGTVKGEVNGTYTFGVCAGDGDGSDCQYSMTAVANTLAVPQTQYRALVEVTAAFVTIQGLRIDDSAGNSLDIKENYALQSRFIGRHVDMQSALKRCVLVSGAVDGGRAFFDDFDMDYCSLQIPDGISGIWSASVSFNSNDATIKSGIVMQNSRLTNSGAEGYSTLSIGGVVFRDSYIANTHRVAFFPDASQNVVFERMTAVMSGHPLTGNRAEAFATAVECYGPSLTYDSTGHILRDSVIYNVAGTANFIRFAIEGNSGCPEPHRSNGYDPRNEGFIVGATIVGNTFYAVDSSVFAIKCTICTTSANGIVIKNNAIIGTSNVQNVAPNWDMDYNGWSEGAPSDADARGANDVNSGILLTNDATWSATNPPLSTDVQLSAGDALLDAGTPLTSAALDIADYLEWGNFSGGCILTEPQWEQTSYADINCTARDGVAPNIGAWEGTP